MSSCVVKDCSEPVKRRVRVRIGGEPFPDGIDATLDLCEPHEQMVLGDVHNYSIAVPKTDLDAEVALALDAYATVTDRAHFTALGGVHYRRSP